jgi:hypothetical protein
MKKEYTKPTALAVALASEGTMMTSSSVEVDTNSTIDQKSGYLTNQEKPGAGLWDK